MITGYHRDDVRPSCDVWAASGGWGKSAKLRVSPWCMQNVFAHMTNRPSLVMLPEAMELSRTTFACPNWRLSGVAGTKESAYGAGWAQRTHATQWLPAQCSFHCTKPDRSAESAAVHALLHAHYWKSLRRGRNIENDVRDEQTDGDEAGDGGHVLIGI